MYCYRIYGEEHLWTGIDFIEEVRIIYKRTIVGYKGNKTIRCIDLELDRPISKELLEKYNLRAELMNEPPRPILIPVQYRRHRYPTDIMPTITEVAGHFDKEWIYAKGDYSLHTEYSFGTRRFNTEFIKEFSHIYNANLNGIPQLWYSEEWATDFAEFILALTSGHKEPMVIEIHPPFNDYSNIDRFLQCFNVFQRQIQSQYGEVIYLVENRCGTRYRQGSFIISNIDELEVFSKRLDETHIPLKLTLDIPQLFTVHNVSTGKLQYMSELLEHIRNIKHNIGGIHLWGKTVDSRIAHMGNLDTYFYNKLEVKELFLQKMFEVFSDNVPRYFVPEVNSSEQDLRDIVNDLIDTGFRFN